MASPSNEGSFLPLIIRYRAKVSRASALKKEALLQFIDYGNEETLPFSRIRPLEAKFKSLAGQAKSARLRSVAILATSELTNQFCEACSEVW